MAWRTSACLNCQGRPCPSTCPTILFCTGSCSLYGVCLTTLVGVMRNTAPTISLVTTAAAPATTTIKYGYNYTTCGGDQQPAVGAECELEATAQDAQDGDLTASVLVCAPSSCTNATCISSKYTMSCDLLYSAALVRMITSSIGIETLQWLEYSTVSKNTGHLFVKVGLMPCGLNTAKIATDGTTPPLPAPYPPLEAQGSLKNHCCLPRPVSCS